MSTVYVWPRTQKSSKSSQPANYMKQWLTCQNSWRHIFALTTIKWCTYCFGTFRIWSVRVVLHRTVSRRQAGFQCGTPALNQGREGGLSFLAKAAVICPKKGFLMSETKKSFNHAKHLLCGGKLLRPHSQINWFMEQQPSLPQISFRFFLFCWSPSKWDTPDREKWWERNQKKKKRKKKRGWDGITLSPCYDRCPHVGQINLLYWQSMCHRAQQQPLHISLYN